MVKIEEVEQKDIVMRFDGNDARFMASEGKVSIYITESMADSIAFHLNTILQDRERSREVRGGQNV